MSTDKKLSKLIINKLTQEQFDEITPSNDELYLVEETKEYATVEELATKQDIISDLDTIRTGAELGSTALQSIPQASTTTLGGIKAGNWLKVNADSAKLECGELTKAQYDSALGYTFISKTTLNNVLVDYTKSSNIKTINGESILGSGDIVIKSAPDLDNVTISKNDNEELQAIALVDGENTLTASDIHTLIENKKSYHPDIFSVKWSDHLINDIQWLRADTFSWQSGDVYKTAYDTLVSEYATGTTETDGSITFKRTTNGFKIADSSQEQAILDKYNTDGVAWYYILDTTNKRFKLPRTKWGFKGLRDTVANDIDEKLPNISGSFSAWGNTYSQVGVFYEVAKTTTDGSTYVSSGGYRTTTSFDASRSSSTYQDNAPVQERGTQMYLYFYVGEYSREAIEQTAGITSEQLNSKVDKSGDTMTGDLLVEGLFDTKAMDIDVDVAPEETQYYGSRIQDKNGTRIGMLEVFMQPDKVLGCQIKAMREVDGTPKYSYMRTLIDVNGNASCSFSNTKCVDGQWVSKGLTLSETKTAATRSANLKTNGYLPNDGYKYEVMVRIIANNHNSSVSNLYVYSDILTGTIRIGSVSANGYHSAWAGIIPVNNTLYWQISAAVSESFSIWVGGYRRIGTNG